MRKGWEKIKAAEAAKPITVYDEALDCIVRTMQRVPHWTPRTLVQALAEEGLLIMDPVEDES